MAYIDPDAVFGAPPAAAPQGGKPVTGGYVDPDAVFGGPPPDTRNFLQKGLDFAERVTRPAVTAVKSQLATPETTAKRMDMVGGTFAQMGDMVASLPAATARAVTYWPVRKIWQLLGADEKSASVMAKELVDKIPQELASPYASIAKRMGPRAEAAFKNNPIGWAMDMLGKTIEHGAAKGEETFGVSQEALSEAANTAMTVMGVTGTAAAARAGARYKANVAQGKELARADQVNQQAAGREQTMLEGDAKARAEREAILREMTVEPGDLRAILQEAKKNKAPTPDEVGQAQVGQIFDRAKGEALTPEQAIAASKARIEAAREAAAPGASLGVVPKGRIAEPTIIGEPPAKGLPPALESAMEKISNDGRALLTAEERIALQDTARTAGIVDERGNPLQSRQGGKMDQETLLKLAGVASGAAVGLPAFQAAWNHFNPEKEISFKSFLDNGNLFVQKGMPGQEDRDITPRKQPQVPDQFRPPEWKPMDPWRGKGDKLVDAGLAGAAAGMVFGRKGMPHPKFLQGLAQQLKAKILPADIENGGGFSAAEIAGRKQVQDTFAWADKAISKWVQKGDLGQGVAEVQIPIGPGTESLGKLINQVIAENPVELAKPFKGSEKIPAGESVWEMRKDLFPGVTTAINNYMSHVGDYLRANVPPDKLPQYDIPRAIRETAANDARMAKEMERAAAKATMELPAVREYPNGQRWVELKLPERLTPEQMKGIRVATTAERRGDFLSESEPGKPLFVATDAKGNVIKNNYTESAATGPTPEAAYLAGRLAEEGNSMGHCVGCYASDVMEGNSRIFSLRDGKGASHVTIEVSPRTGRQPNADGVLEPLTGEDIVQIKGKQNRAPVADYLPAVQDFVRNPPEGKAWGEVGDLDNTGLRSMQQAPLSKLQKEFFEKEHPGKQYLTQEEFDAAQENWRLSGPQFQQGFADPKLLAKIAGVGGAAALGAAVDPQNATRGAIVGAALAGLIASRGGRERIAEAAHSADQLLGLASTRLRNVSEPLLRKAREYEQAALEVPHQLIQRADPFLMTLNKLPAELRGQVNRALLTGDDAKVRASFHGMPEALTQLGELRQVLKEVGSQLKEGGWISRIRDDYFPRIVKDPEGLLSALGKEMKDRLTERLDKAEAASLKVTGRGLSDVEKSIIINQELRVREPTSGRQGYTKERGVDEVTAELEPFYYTPTESFHSYVTRAVAEIEKAKFFGRDLERVKSGNVSYVDTDASIGNVLRREREAGRITAEQQKEVAQVLRARFGKGDQAPAGWIQDVRNLTNLGLLGNVVSAATQMADAPMAVFHADLRGTASAVAQSIAGKQRITAKDFGLIDHLSEEFVSTRGTAKALNTAFKYSGFTAVDLFGKNTLLNASLNMFERQAQTVKGQAAIADKWGKFFEGDMAQLLDDLQNKRMSPLVRELLWNKLSDAQPISKLEMPEAYLNNPDLRIGYQLKSFMLKQIDIARVQGYNEMRKGNYGTGMKNLVAYGTLLGVSGATTDMIKDWMLGRGLHAPEWKDVALNTVKTFGWSEFVLDKAMGGHPVQAAMGIAAPPAAMLDAIWQKGGSAAINQIPVIGRLLYPHTETGELAEAKRARKKELGQDPEHQEKLRERRTLREERMQDPLWRQYYLDRAKGEKPARPQ